MLFMVDWNAVTALSNLLNLFKSLILDISCFLFKSEKCLLHLWIAEFDPHFEVMIILHWSSFSVASLSDIVFHHTFVFFCSFCPCSAAAGCQENQGLSLCLQHTLCAQHRVTCVPCIFRHLAVPLHHRSFSSQPLNESELFPAVWSDPFSFKPHIFSYDTVKKRTCLFYCV